jgi:hypothetical protein
MTHRSLALFVFFGLACTDAEKAPPCSQNSDCDVGEACIEKECTTAECLSSADCDLGEHCSSKLTCTTGCEEDTDCLAGQSCNDGTCAAYGCRDTHLDCAYGEMCDPTTGTCYPDDAGSCDNCDPGNDANCYAVYEQGPCSSSGSCPSGQECYITEYDDTTECRTDADCASDELCLSLNTGSGTIGPHCSKTSCFSGATYPACDPSVANECARGFQCQEVSRNQGVCFGDCEWLRDNGYL